MRTLKIIKIVFLTFLSYQLITVRAHEGESEDALNPSNSSRQGRWSIFDGWTREAEHLCAAKCREIGNKPFGHLLGAKCHCLCPINAKELNLCSPNGNSNGKYCFPFCQNIGYFKGGLCLNRNCMCTCGLLQVYDPSINYTTPASA